MSVTSAVLVAVDSPTRLANPSRPLRVLQVIASVADVNGGATTAMWATLKALQNRNVYSELATTNEDGPHRLLNVPTSEFIQHGDHRVRFFPSRGDRYTTSWTLARWLFAHVRDYDLVHIHGLFRFAPVAAAHIALARGVPYVLTPHNTLGQWGMSRRRPLLKRLSIGLVEGRVIDRAGRVHLCSFDELSQASRVRALGKRSRVFPLGVDVQDDAARKPSDAGAADDSDGLDLLDSLDGLAGRPVVLFMSRIHEIKGLDELLLAFVGIRRAFPDAVLTIAGTGEKQLVARLQSEAQRLGIGDHTRWLGFVQGRQKERLLSLATVFVLPSHSENFGYAVVEAMLAGLPVVTTVNVPSGRFVTEADSGIIYDGTTAQLEQSIRKILDMSEDQRQLLGSRAAAAAGEQLSLRTYGDSLEGIYREVAGGAS